MSIVQGEIALTSSESKRLIAKAVAAMPIVRQALQSGTVIVTKGTTNWYVAEEILGRRLDRAGFVLGRTCPAKGGRRLGTPQEQTGEVVLRAGKEAPGLSLADAVKDLQAGDVVVKGANALDYENRTVGILIGHPESGTIGRVYPVIVARKAHLVIPVGIEKCVPGRVTDLANRLREPIETVGGDRYSMFAVTGCIVTEVEALAILAGVETFPTAAGGVGGAEGAVRLAFRGSRQNVEKALRLVADIQGEPPFAG